MAPVYYTYSGKDYGILTTAVMIEFHLFAHKIQVLGRKVKELWGAPFTYNPHKKNGLAGACMVVTIAYGRTGVSHLPWWVKCPEYSEVTS